MVDNPADLISRGVEANLLGIHFGGMNLCG